MDGSDAHYTRKEEEREEMDAMIILSVVMGGFIGMFLYLYNLWLLKPNRLRSKLQSQGVKGPSPSFLYGNVPEMKRILLDQLQSKSMTAGRDHRSHHDVDDVAHDWPANVFPHILQWQKEYGPVFMYSSGNVQILWVADPEMVKEMNLCTSLSLGKPSFLSKQIGPLLGLGILSSSGTLWAHQRKIIAPELYLEKVKGMVNLMVDSITEMLKSWERETIIEGGTADIRVDKYFMRLSANIISRACFGSNYTRGEEISLQLRTLMKIMSKVPLGVPGSRFLPSKNNRKIWRLEKEIHSMIVEVVKARTETTQEKDLLQMILDAAKSSGDGGGLPEDISPNKFIVDSCTNMYLAGHDSNGLSASWCLMLLAMYPEWQARVRSEVFEICGEELPDADMLRRMKTLTMVIQETMRLYPPVAYVVRETLEDMNFRGIQIPKGINLQIPIPLLHHNPDLWGPDVHKFKPERFAQGTLGACKNPQAYMPFGVGPHTCAGQHFGLLELKVTLSLILSRFSFSVSPEYRHSPVLRMVLIEPEHGVTIRVRKL